MLNHKTHCLVDLEFNQSTFQSLKDTNIWVHVTYQQGFLVLVWHKSTTSKSVQRKITLAWTEHDSVKLVICPQPNVLPFDYTQATQPSHLEIWNKESTLNLLLHSS